MTEADAIVSFWTEIGPSAWYATDPDLDARIRARFEPTWQAARAGAFRDWWRRPGGALAYLLLTDQFPRNMFRGSGLSFATDSAAFECAVHATQANIDLSVPPPLRQFFYLPFMHAETRPAQQRGVCLFLTRMPGTDNLDHARAHRWVIRRFGRFPYRNDALGRETSGPEAEFLHQGGYGAALRAVTS